MTPNIEPFEDGEDEIEDLIVLDSESVSEEIPTLVRTKKIEWAEFIGSSFLFASAYLLLYILYDLVTALAAAHFELEPVLFYDTIRYENNGGWYPHCVKRVFLVGSIAMGF
ncbi:MAG: hypothetical protein RL266_2003, partial [Bacteroidota bacterium]